jgi:hypothetical protein
LHLKAFRPLPKKNQTHIKPLRVNIFGGNMARERGNAGLKLMMAAAALLAFLVIFIFLNSNNVSALEALRIIPA